MDLLGRPRSGLFSVSKFKDVVKQMTESTVTPSDRISAQDTEFVNGVRFAFRDIAKAIRARKEEGG